MIETLNKLVYEVQVDSEDVNDIVEGLVLKYSQELDEFIEVVKKLLDNIKKGKLDEYPDHVLEIQAIKLPVLMYFAGSGLEVLGAESDIAKGKRLAEYNNILMKVSGTIPEKQAIATSGSKVPQIVDDIYSRAYKTLKIKIEMADKVFSALKKVLQKRITEINIGGMERGLPHIAEEGEEND